MLIGDEVVEPIPLVVAVAVAVVAVAEPPGAAGAGAACCAANAEFRRGLRVEVPGEGNKREGEREIRIRKGFSGSGILSGKECLTRLYK